MVIKARFFRISVTRQIVRFTDIAAPAPRSRELFHFVRLETLTAWSEQQNTLRRRLAWAIKRGIRIDFIQPGQPQQNAYVERYDWLAHHLFEILEEIQDFATQWLWTYNHD